CQGRGRRRKEYRPQHRKEGGGQEGPILVSPDTGRHKDSTAVDACVCANVMCCAFVLSCRLTWNGFFMKWILQKNFHCGGSEEAIQNPLPLPPRTRPPPIYHNGERGDYLHLHEP